MSAIDIVHVDSNHIFATWRNVFLVLWRAQTLPHAIQGLKSTIVRVGNTHPAGIGMLTIVEPCADLPSQGAREELPKLFRSVASYTSCSALVFEGAGFRAAAIRALTTTFNMVASQPFPHKVFASVDDAERFFMPLLPPSCRGEKLKSGELSHTVSEIRRHFDAWTANREHSMHP